MAWSGKNYKGAARHRKALRHEEALARIAAKTEHDAKHIVTDVAAHWGIEGDQPISAQSLDSLAVLVGASDARIAHESVVGL